MSTEACLLLFGVRYEVRPDEIEGLERRSDPRLAQARRAGLKHYWGNFGLPGEKYLLFVGYQIALLGVQDKLAIDVSAPDFERIVADTSAKLREAGFQGEPRLFAQWMPDA